MDRKSETRLAVKRGRASDLMLGGSEFEDNASPIARQVAFVAKRYAVGPALAQVLAEHVFRTSPPR